MIEIGSIALASVLSPALAKAQKSSMEQFTRLYGESVRILIVISAPVGGLFAVLGDQFVLAIYGSKYASAGIVLRIVGPSLVFLVPGALAHPVFAALGRQTLFMWLSGMAVIINVGAGVVFAHYFSYVGMAWVTLFTEFFTFTVGAA